MMRVIEMEDTMSDRREIVPARLARIEFLRARAAYEREALTFHTTQLGSELSPRNWLSGLLRAGRASTKNGHSSVASVLGQSFSLVAQYPYITATVSSLLIGKRWRWLKWAGLGLGIWRAYSETTTRKE